MATRRSIRLVAKEDTEAAVTATEQPTTKKAQSSKKQKTAHRKGTSNDNAIESNQRVRGKRGALKFMKEMPMDVLLEIFRLLEPIDLLHLSRVSKNLHGLLTSDDVRFLWKSAYMNIDSYVPPLCPDDTNIVFYTDFLYGRHCQFCASIYGRLHHESAFIRLCSKCADKKLESFTQAGRMCHTWTLPLGKGRVLTILKAEHTLRWKELKQAQKEKRKDTYWAERTLVVAERAKIANELNRWRVTIQNQQIRAVAAIRAQREADIKMKLAEEGYLDDFNRLRYHAHRIPHVRKPQRLTDSEWAFIRADIIEFFQVIRDDKSLSDMRYTLQWRVRDLDNFISDWRIRPTAWWIVSSSEPIASFVKRKEKENFEQVEPQLREAAALWREETDRYLTTLVPGPSGKGKKKAHHNALELATTFFKCHWCTEPISYPRVLMHSCFEKKPDAEGEADDHGLNDSDEEEDVVIHSRAPRQPRPAKEITPDTVLPTLSNYFCLGICKGMEGVTYDKEASDVVRKLVTLCGEDPNTVTYAAMEEAQGRFECLRCSRAMQAKTTKSARLVMNWTMALVHELQNHYEEPPSSEPAWRKIDLPEDIEKVRAAENHMKKLKKYQHVVFCNHCSRTCFDIEHQLGHIVQDHKITVDTVTVSEHFNPPVDAAIAMLHPAVKI